MQRKLELCAALGFIGLIAAPTVDSCLRPENARDSRHENRAPALAPACPTSLDSAMRWPRAFDDHFRDTSGGRDFLLGARNTALLALGCSSAPYLDVGGGGWIFYRGDRAFEAHRGLLGDSADRMEEWIAALAARQTRLAARGIRFLFALVPDKETIYPELLPGAWQPVDRSLGDRFLAELSRRSDVEFVDLRPALLAAKAFDQPEIEDFVYHPRGTHWTSRGACAANRAIVEKLAGWFPMGPPIDCATLQLVPLPTDADDTWARAQYTPWLMRSVWALSPAGGWPVAHGIPPEFGNESTLVEAGDPAWPSVYFAHDSYGPYLHPFLAGSCGRLRAVWHPLVDERVLRTDHPDVVLLIRAERALSTTPQPDIPSEGPALVVPDRDTLVSANAVWKLAPDRTGVTASGRGRFEDERGSVVWHTENWDDHFVVDLGGRVPAGRSFLVLYDLDSDAAAQLDLLAGVEGKQEWSFTTSVRAPLVKGRNCELIVVDGMTSGRLLVRVGRRGAWRFRRFEVHALAVQSPESGSASSAPPVIRSK